MPFVFIAFAVYFSINAIADRGRLFGNLIFVILAIGFAVKIFKQVKSPRSLEPN